MKKNICLLFFLLTLSACSSHVVRGKQHFLSQNYRQAFPDIEAAAKNGNAESQYALGYMYYYGYGIDENARLAKYWMRKAAKQGYEPAQQALSLVNNAR